MEYDVYYKFFKEFFKGKSYEYIFEEGKKMEKALFAAKHEAAASDWYGIDKGDD